MQGRLPSCSVVFSCFVSFVTHATAADAQNDILFHFGGPGNQRLHSAVTLSDGSILIGGGATDMGWVPSTIPVVTWDAKGMKSGDTGATAFLLHLDPANASPKALYTLPKGLAHNIRSIKTTAVPGAPTGDLYLSGTVAADPSIPKDIGGYFIAKLDGNFVGKKPTGFSWITRIKAGSDLADRQPWDVDAKGRVVHATGEPHSYNWMAVNALDAEGRLAVVPHWPRHWHAQGEWIGPIQDAPSPVTHSGIVLKTWDRGDFRSTNPEDFSRESPDGNGGIKKGKWPFDAMFDGYFDPQTKKTVPITGTGKGYYGYRWGGTPCANIGAIAIDRRTGTMFLGGNNKSKLPDGNPDFEPWVVAMDSSGLLLWWQRLYPEADGVSTPDQYVDGLAIDYSRPLDSGGALVALARAHGNNVNNFWRGDRIKHPENPGYGFQNGFTGTSGNIHYSWLGKMTLRDGTMLAATYLAEFAEGAKHGKTRFSDPLLSDWPRFDSGWPDLNTTRARRALWLGPDGQLGILATGRRVLTTANAFQKMPSPLTHPDQKGTWSDFIRIYSPMLDTIRYSSLITGSWDPSTGSGGGNVTLESMAATPGGLLVVGYSHVDKKSGDPAGADLPVRNAPAWVSRQRSGEEAVIAILRTAP